MCIQPCRSSGQGPLRCLCSEGPVRVKLGRTSPWSVSAGEPRSSARWTRIGAPTHLEQRAHGLLDSHTVLQVRPGRSYLWI